MMSASSLEGVLNGFAISFPRSFPLWWYAQTIWQCSLCSQCSSLIIWQQSISVLMHVMRSWGSSPGLGHHILEFSKVHMGVDIMCHSLLDSVQEGRRFCLDHFLFLFAAHMHPLHRHLQGFGSQGCKEISEVVLTVRHDAVEEEPVLQDMPKDGEGVIHPSSPSCRWAGLMDAVLAVSALVMASAVAWADWVESCCGVGQIMVRSAKQGEDTKMAVSLEPSVQFTSNLDRMYLRVCPTTRFCMII